MLVQKIGALDLQGAMRPETAVSKPTPANESTRKGPTDQAQQARDLAPVDKPPESEVVVSILDLGSPAEPDPSAMTEAIQEQAQERLDKRLKDLVDQVNSKMDENLSLRFREDAETGIDYFQIIEKESGDVIRQYPPEEVLTLIQRVREMQGLLVSEEA